MPSLSLDLVGFYVGHVVHLFGDYAALFATESGLFFRYRQLNVGHHPSTITRSTSIRPLHHLAIIYTSISRSLRLNISSVERCIYPYSAALLPRQSLILYFSPSLSPDQLARPSDRGHCMHHRAVNIITTVYCLLTKKIYNSLNEKLNSYSQCPLTLMIHDTAVLFPRGIAISGKRKNIGLVSVRLSVPFCLTLMQLLGWMVHVIHQGAVPTANADSVHFGPSIRGPIR